MPIAQGSAKLPPLWKSIWARSIEANQKERARRRLLRPWAPESTRTKKQNHPPRRSSAFEKQWFWYWLKFSGFRAIPISLREIFSLALC
jgi:hypothetical protein